MLLRNTNKYKLLQLPIDKIYPNPAQPRRSFSEEDLQGLAQSIRQNGLLQPIIVKKVENGYELIAGERRLRACKMAGYQVISAIVTEYSEKQSAVLAILENLQRQNLHFFEESTAIARLMQQLELTQEQAAVKLGISQSALANKLRILRLGPAERELIVQGKLTERHARAVLKLTTPEQRIEVLRAAIAKSLNVKQTEQLVEQTLCPKKETQHRTFIAKDVRLFMNTIDHAVQSMLQAGIEAQSTQDETEEFIICTVKIPKRGAAVSSLCAKQDIA